MMKQIVFLFLFISMASYADAQKFDSIFVNLYTDSLKKGTYNYINVDGRLSNGKFLPLDSNYLVFKSNKGQFFGNSLWIEEDFKDPLVRICITMKNDSTVKKEFDMYIKTMEDPDNLKTNQEILEEYKQRSRNKSKQKKRRN